MRAGNRMEKRTAEHAARLFWLMTEHGVSVLEFVSGYSCLLSIRHLSKVAGITRIRLLVGVLGSRQLPQTQG